MTWKKSSWEERVELRPMSFLLQWWGSLKDDDDNYKTEKVLEIIKFLLATVWVTKNLLILLNLSMVWLQRVWRLFFELIEEIGQAGFQADPAKMFADFIML